MTRENAKCLLPIIEAYANGETIQMYDGREWINRGDPIFFDGEPIAYRIKPKLREWWLVKYEGGAVGIYNTKPMAKHEVEVEIIHVVESP